MWKDSKYQLFERYRNRTKLIVTRKNLKTFYLDQNQKYLFIVQKSIDLKLETFGNHNSKDFWAVSKMLCKNPRTSKNVEHWNFYYYSKQFFATNDFWPVSKI